MFKPKKGGKLDRMLSDKLSRFTWKKDYKTEDYDISKEALSKFWYLDPVKERKPHRYVLIFLHGLADAGEGMIDLFVDDTKEWYQTP